MDKYGGIFFEQAEWLMLKDLDPYEIKVFICLITILKWKGKEWADTSLTHISAVSHISRPVVLKNVNSLIKKGLVYRKVYTYSDKNVKKLRKRAIYKIVSGIQFQ